MKENLAFIELIIKIFTKIIKQVEKHLSAHIGQEDIPNGTGCAGPYKGKLRC